VSKLIVITKGGVYMLPRKNYYISTNKVKIGAQRSDNKSFASYTIPDQRLSGVINKFTKR
jgi:hypothetical protein